MIRCGSTANFFSLNCTLQKKADLRNFRNRCNNNKKTFNDFLFPFAALLIPGEGQKIVIESEETSAEWCVKRDSREWALAARNVGEKKAEKFLELLFFILIDSGRKWLKVSCGGFFNSLCSQRYLELLGCWSCFHSHGKLSARAPALCYLSEDIPFRYPWFRLSMASKLSLLSLHWEKLLRVFTELEFQRS